MRRIAATVALVVLTVLPWNVRAELADAIEAVVHDSIISSHQVEEFTAPFAEELRRQYRGDPETFRTKIGQLVTENTERLIENELILHEFETAGYNLPDSVIDDYVMQRIRARYGTRATLTKTLQAEGITFEKFRQQIKKQFIVEQMRLKNISDAVVISPHKIEVYYVAHTNDFKIEEEVKLRMIVLNKPTDDAGQTRALADEILAKINSGVSFAEMATSNSQDSKKSQGGDWGWVDQTVLRKELADAAFALKPGEKSPVIDLPGACYLLTIEDKRPAHIKPLSDVRDEIEKILLSQERDRLQKQWVERLKKKTFVRYF